MIFTVLTKSNIQYLYIDDNDNDKDDDDKDYNVNSDRDDYDNGDIPLFSVSFLFMN